MQRQEFDLGQFKKFLTALKESKCLDSVLVIGSWAEFLYKECNVFGEKDYEPPLGTTDLDFLVRDTHTSEKAKNLVNNIKAQGFESRVDYDSQINMFHGKGEFEVEFLVGQRWGEVRNNGWQPMTELGLRATGKPDMWPMLENFMPVRYHDFRILVPEPEAYVVHKMLINNTREAKAIPDAEKIVNLLKYIDRERFSEIVDKCHTSETARIEAFFRKYTEYLSVNAYLSQEIHSVSHEKEQIYIFSISDIVGAEQKYAESGIDERMSAKSLRQASVSEAYDRLKSAGFTKEDMTILKKKEYAFNNDEHKRALELLKQYEYKLKDHQKIKELNNLIM